MRPCDTSSRPVHTEPTGLGQSMSPLFEGHAYEALTSDVFARPEGCINLGALQWLNVFRYHRLLGQDVFFMTGADEHGLVAQLPLTFCSPSPHLPSPFPHVPSPSPG